MDTTVNIKRIIPAETVPEGAGVTVYRTIGAPALRNYDPFLLLDHISSDNPDDYAAGFPSHPHRGFSTFTYMIDGYMQHKDSMGNHGNMEPGSAQWMKAGSGIVHSEMPKQKNGLMRGFQLWINLPAAHKMDHPEYQEFSSDAFPLVETPDYLVKVLIGSFGNANAPIADDLTEVIYLDVTVKPGKRFYHMLPDGCRGFIYVFEGMGQSNVENIPVHSLAIFDGVNHIIDFTAGPDGARLVVASGKPIEEPIVRHGPFVMNTREQIDQAVRDYQSNDFVRNRAWVKRNQ
ncbi:MAG: pirin family protein [Nitrosomonas sp. PRO4]|nr:pirin family protein [Nitrosomonas sp. PRO4]